MKRGDIVPVALRGDFGKPRPAVVIQTDQIQDSDSTIVCLIISRLRSGLSLRRIKVVPSTGNGLQKPSQIMVEKINIVLLAKCGDVIGRLETRTVERLDEALAFAMGLFGERG